MFGYFCFHLLYLYLTQTWFSKVPTKNKHRKIKKRLHNHYWTITKAHCSIIKLTIGRWWCNLANNFLAQLVLWISYLEVLLTILVSLSVPVEIFVEMEADENVPENISKYTRYTAKNQTYFSLQISSLLLSSSLP